VTQDDSKAVLISARKRPAIPPNPPARAGLEFTRPGGQPAGNRWREPETGAASLTRLAVLRDGCLPRKVFVAFSQQFIVTNQSHCQFCCIPAVPIIFDHINIKIF
jgi:hypothetical protein